MRVHAFTCSTALHEKALSMSHNGPRIDEPPQPWPDPYDRLLSINLEPRWTDQQLNQHILEAVRYGVRMERERILSATKRLTLEEPGAISQVGSQPGGTP